MYSFQKIRAAVIKCKHGVVQVHPTFRPKILTFWDVSENKASYELGKSESLIKMECTISKKKNPKTYKNRHMCNHAIHRWNSDEITRFPVLLKTPEILLNGPLVSLDLTWRNTGLQHFITELQ